MKAFVFFTNRNRLIENPIGIPEDNLNGFGQDNKHILIIEYNKKLTPINIIENLPEDYPKPFFLLIYDEIELPPPNQNNNEIGNCFKIKKLLKDHENIYLVIHESCPSNCLQAFQRIFPNSLKSWIFESHIEDSIYDRILKRVLNDSDIEDLSFLEDEIISEFPDPFLEARIHLWKELTLLGLKIKKENVTEKDFKQAISNINNEVINRIDEVKDELQNFQSFENFDNDMKSLYNELFPDTS